MRNSNVFLTFSALAACLLAGGLAAQDVAIDRNASLDPPSHQGRNTFEVAYSFADLDGLSGGQFRLHYDPELVTVADLSGCLANLPETHQGSFSVCNDIRDKGFVQFVVLDFGRNNEVGSGSLGAVKFTVKPGASVQAAADAIKIQDVRLAGPDGRHLKPVGQSINDVRVELKR